MTDTSLFDQGLTIRREVLGTDYVNASLAGADEFGAPMQKLVTEWCWGEVWGRPDLDRRTRSAINLAMLAALNRQHELKVHVRGALNNGLTRTEIREILLQSAVYCGVPAGLEAMRSAREALAAIDAEETKNDGKR